MVAISLLLGELFPYAHGYLQIHIENVLDEHLDDPFLIPIEVGPDLLDFVVCLFLEVEFVLPVLFALLELLELFLFLASEPFDLFVG
jgi:hypothetical protein